MQPTIQQSQQQTEILWLLQQHARSARANMIMWEPIIQYVILVGARSAHIVQGLGVPIAPFVQLDFIQRLKRTIWTALVISVKQALIYQTRGPMQNSMTMKMTVLHVQMVPEAMQGPDSVKCAPQGIKLVSWVL